MRYQQHLINLKLIRMEISKNESKEKKERPRNLWKEIGGNKHWVNAISFKNYNNIIKLT